MPYWIILGDIHSNTSALHNLPNLKEAEGIIVTGDLTQFGGAKEAAKVLAELRGKNRVAAALCGNLDNEAVSDLLHAEGLNSHAMCRRLEAADGQAFYLLGLGGSNITPFKTPIEYSEEALEGFLKAGFQQYQLLNANEPLPLLLCSHTPPVNTTCDKISAGFHVGSPALRAFIEKYQPALCVCGHIHEAVGYDVIGATPVVNPGAFMQGGYVRLDLNQGELKAQAMKV